MGGELALEEATDLS